MTENFVNSFMSTLVEDIPNKYLILKLPTLKMGSVP